MPHRNYLEVVKNITYSHPERCSQLSEPSLQMQLCYILQLCWDWKQIENFIFKWLFKSTVRKFNFITFPRIRKLHVLFDIIKLSSYHRAKHWFYFLKAYVIHHNCGSSTQQWTVLVIRSALHWAEDPWRTESTMYGKCR